MLSLVGPPSEGLGPGVEELDTFRTLITVGGALLTLAGAWFAVKYGLKSNTEKIDKLSRQVEVQWKRLDEVSVETQKFETTISWQRKDIDDLREEQKYQSRKS